MRETAGVDPYEVGTWRFCPACGRPVTQPDGDWPDELTEAPWCPACDLSLIHI